MHGIISTSRPKTPGRVSTSIIGPQIYWRRIPELSGALADQTNGVIKEYESTVLKAPPRPSTTYFDKCDQATDPCAKSHASYVKTGLISLGLIHRNLFLTNGLRFLEDLVWLDLFVRS